MSGFGLLGLLAVCGCLVLLCMCTLFLYGVWTLNSKQYFSGDEEWPE
jgi:hypothetical protein